MLDVTKAGFGYNGMMELSAGVKQSVSLKVLKLRGNPRAFHAFSKKVFVENIFACSTLEILDISENNLDFSSVKLYLNQKLKTGKKIKMLESQISLKTEASCVPQDQFQLVNHGNYLFEETLNTLTHAIGAGLGALASIVLLYNAFDKDRFTFYSCAIYCFTIVFLYASSSIYHSHFGNKRISDILEILDHCAIYLLIAGTYTPFCLVSLRDHELGIRFALIEWGLAAAGIVLTLLAKRVHIPFHSVFELSLYVGMGHLIYLVWDDIHQLVNVSLFCPTVSCLKLLLIIIA